MPPHGHPDNWPRIQNFINVLAAEIEISKKGPHLAVTTFGRYSELRIPFSRHESLSSFIQDVNSIPPARSSATDMIDGLNRALNDMFIERNGMRRDAPKTLIFMTDGICTPPTSCFDSFFIEVKQKFIDRRIKIIGIAVGNTIRESQIKSILEDSKNYYHLASFSLLTQKSFVRSLSVCDGMYMNLPSTDI